MLSLYIHIPFCLQKCLYCDFLSAPQDTAVREVYVQALIREIRLSRELFGRREADTVFFGGGTPSILSPSQLRSLMEALRQSFSILPDAEISLEMNPGTADAEKLCRFREAGIGRLSIGVQSMQDDELKLLGRIHSRQQAKETFRLARKAGFDNINLDLMSALPGQAFDSWADTLARAADWGPEHISAYSLLLEPGTPFAAMQQAGELPPLPDEETDRRMYHFTREFLAQHGYVQYEISNYAKPGRECRHNTGYWTGHPYLGLGIGAASFVDGVRWSNTRSLSEYLQAFSEAACPLRPGPHENGQGTGHLPPDCAGTTEKRLSNRDIRLLPENTYMEDALSAGRQSRTNVRLLPDCAGTTERPSLYPDVRTDIRRLSLQEQMEEFMFLGLRMTEGVRFVDFTERFGKDMEAVYGAVLRRHAAQGLLERTGAGVRLTARGIDISSYVLADFLL